MAEVGGCGSEEMRGNDQDHSPERCRERRRRRIELRRFGASTSAGSSSSASPASSHGIQESSRGSSSTTTEMPANNATNVAPVAILAPDVGAMSVAGRLRDMEDAIAIRVGLCRPEINSYQPLHYFAVFDGHGGPHVAALCREWMHVILEEEVMRGGNITAANASGASTSNPPPQLTQRTSRREKEAAWKRILKASFARMDELASNDSCRLICGDQKCDCHPAEMVFSGSTAVIVILTQDFIIVANCGDSRAVLCRQGRSIPLTTDHKPDRADERARIEARGGRVFFNEGARVEGILAMSRAIGDKYLKPVLTAEPDVFFKRRNPDDECLILGSDGLWDVVNGSMACQVAKECLIEEKPEGGETSNVMPWRAVEWSDSMFPSRSASAAGMLTRLALGRRSYDNISVIVVDLKKGQGAST